MKTKAHYIIADCWRRDLEIFDMNLSGNGVWFSFWNGEIYGDLELEENGNIKIAFSKKGGSEVLLTQSSKNHKMIIKTIDGFYK